MPPVGQLAEICVVVTAEGADVVAVRSFRQKGPPHCVRHLHEYFKLGKAVQVTPLKHGLLAHGFWLFCDVVDANGEAVDGGVGLDEDCVVTGVLELVFPPFKVVEVETVADVDEVSVVVDGTGTLVVATCVTIAVVRLAVSLEVGVECVVA